jgi:hypothetical protein
MRFKQKAAITAAAGCLLVQGIFAAMPANYAGVLFDSLKGIPHQIPGFINLPYFDKGDTNVTFRYTWNNMGDCFWRANDPGKKVSLQMFGDYKDILSGAPGLPDRDPSIPHIPDSACYPAGKNAHLGWIQVGEWFNYTVHVNTAGSYTMIFHESVVDATHLVLVTFSGLAPDSCKNIPVSIRPTGDHEQCHDWKWDTTATKLALDTGLYVMNVAFTSEGFNFHGIKFLLDGPSAVTETNRHPTQKGLAVMPAVNGNNLSVSYSLAQAAPTTVSVYDCAGRLMVPAIVRNMNSGSQKEMIDLGNIGRGVYYVRVEQNGIREIKSFMLTR